MKPTARTILIIFCLVLAWSISGAKEDPKKDKRVAKTSLQYNHTYFLINNIFTQFANTMESDFEFTSGQNPGLEWPKGSGKTASYESGFVYAGFYEGKPTPSSSPAHRKFVNGSVYVSGMTEGWITAAGTGIEPPNATYVMPSDPMARCFRIRPDINPYNTQTTTADLVAKIQLEEAPLTSRFSSLSAQQIYDQYAKDWNEWPAIQGAPFKDMNGNGTYEPAVDIPGVPGADQTLWFVCNDMNAAKSQILAGAGAQGIEIQKTIWGYNRQGALGNVYFAKWTLINKSGALIDTMYNALWADIDLGYAGDDYTGVDVARQLGYNYNGKGFDKMYGDSCPASGYAILQGPLVPGAATDSGIFKGAYRHGFKNLKMSTFAPIMNNPSNYYADPPQGNYSDARDQWWNLLTGRIWLTGAPWIDPTTGDTTTFILSGDPITGKGWIDGSFAPPGDRRFCEAAGPYNLAPGDTQEFVSAAMVGQGSDYLSSISALRATCDEARAAYNTLFQIFPRAPIVTVVSTAAPGQNTSLKLTADCRGIDATQVNATLRKYSGAFVASVALYDDGAHEDDAASDGIFANTYSIAQQNEGLYLDGDVSYSNAPLITWRHLADLIATAGPVVLTNPVVVSDNLNEDGIPNPGENVRFTFTLANHSSVDLHNLFVTFGLSDKVISFGTLDTSESFSVQYDPNNASTFFNFTVPSTYSDTAMTLSLSIRDSSGDRWMTAITFPVRSLQNPIKYYSATHTSGTASGEFQLSIVDPTKVTNHIYKIIGLDSINAIRDKGFRLIDSTAGIVLLDNCRLPDVSDHSSPVIDGFRILRGTIDTVNGGVVAIGATKIGSTIYPGRGYNILKKASPDSAWSFDIYGSTSIVSAYSRIDWQFNAAGNDFEIRVTDIPGGTTGGSLIYTTLIGALGTPSTNRCPVELWNVTTNKRLLCNVWDDDNSGTYTLRATPQALSNVGRTGVSRDWERIYASSAVAYTEPLTTGVDASATEILGRMTFIDWNGTGYFPPPGTVIRVWTRHALSSSDSWTFNPTDLLAAVEAPVVPISFNLNQNYPNPFNPSTRISFTIPLLSTVTLKVYNILGQDIATVFEGRLSAGTYTQQWDGKNRKGISVSSGVYFYRLQAGSFVQTKKMIFLK